MSDQTCLHETIVRDIVDVISDVKDSDLLSYAFRVRANDYKSLSSKTQGLTLVFPVITSTSVDITTATMVAKAQERQAVSMLQILFAAVNINTERDIFTFLRKYHTNLGTGNLNVNDFIDVIDDMISESVLECNIPESEFNKIKNDLRNLDFYFESDYSDNGLQDFKVSKKYGSPNVYLEHHREHVLQSETIISENKDNDILENTLKAISSLSTINEAPTDPLDREQRERHHNDEMDQRYREYYRDIDQYDRSYDQRDRHHQDDLNYKYDALDQDDSHHLEKLRQSDRHHRAEMDDKDRRYELDREKYNRDIRNDNRTRITSQLVPNDVKKANELMPTLMTVRIHQLISSVDGNTNDDHDKHNTIPVDVIIGVKAKIYPVDSAEIVNRLISKNKDNNWMLKLVKATTREISFFRDFVFAIDQAKIDAKNSAAKGSTAKIFKILERRSSKSKFLRRVGLNNTAAAISTIHISREEVDLIKKMGNIDVSKAPVIRKLMESYNLMSFVYTDESTESAAFIYDSGDDFYEVMSFNALEREASDTSTKKIVNLMTKMSR